MDKKLWTKPKIVVLCRGNPEESVLTGCKTVANPTGGQTGTYGACVKVTGSTCGPDCKAPVAT